MLITLKEISQRNPLSIVSDTDSYYAKLANHIYRQLKKEDIPMNVSRNSLREIVIKSVKYFEDVISQFGIWASFRNLHNSLYGKKLPFYDIHEDSYIDDEINIADIKYIVWSTIVETNENLILNPYAPGIADVAMLIYDAFDGEFENAPINDNVLDLLCEPTQYDDFMKVKVFLSWILQGCYLTATSDVIETVAEIASTYAFELNADLSFGSYIAMSHLAVTTKTGPLAFEPQKWLAALLEFHNLGSKAEKIRFIVGREIGVYSIEGYDESALTVKSVEGDCYDVELVSFNQEGLDEVVQSPTAMMQIARFGVTWQLNGVCASMNSMGAYEDEVKRWEAEEKRRKTTSDFYHKKSNEKKLLFFADYDEMQRWIGVPAWPSEQLDDLKKKKYLALFLDENDEPTIIYSNVEAINSPDNPFYDEQYATEHALELLFPDFSPSGELVSYLVNNGMLKDASINTNMGRNKEIVQENIDFLTRFLQRGGYCDLRESI